jgi:hypothetical protein
VPLLTSEQMLKLFPAERLHEILDELERAGNTSFNTFIGSEKYTIYTSQIRAALYAPLKARKPMTENENDLDRLIKIMGMTTSDNDGQALVALRTANKQLAKMGTDWATILRGKVRIIADPFASVAAAPPRTPTPAPTPPRPPKPNPPNYGQPTSSNYGQAAPPPRQQAQPSKPKPTLPPGASPNSFDATCAKCGHNVLAGAGMRVLGGKVEHLPGNCLSWKPFPPPAGASRPIKNKHPGTCIKCGGIVDVGDGTVTKVRGKWLCEHNICPASPQKPSVSNVL